MKFHNANIQNTNGKTAFANTKKNKHYTIKLSVWECKLLLQSCVFANVKPQNKTTNKTRTKTTLKSSKE